MRIEYGLRIAERLGARALCRASLLHIPEFLPLGWLCHPARGMSDCFYLQGSSISVTANGTVQKAVGPQANESADKVSIVSKTVEHKAFRMGIQPVDTWRGTTTINITKMDNLDLLSSADI